MSPLSVPFIQAHVFCMCSMEALKLHSGRVPPPPGPHTCKGTETVVLGTVLVKSGQIAHMIHVHVGDEDLVDIVERNAQGIDSLHRTRAHVKDELVAVAQFDEEASGGLLQPRHRHAAAATDDADFIRTELFRTGVVNAAHLLWLLLVASSGLFGHAVAAECAALGDNESHDRRDDDKK